MIAVTSQGAGWLVLDGPRGGWATRRTVGGRQGFRARGQGDDLPLLVALGFGGKGRRAYR